MTPPKRVAKKLIRIARRNGALHATLLAWTSEDPEAQKLFYDLGFEPVIAPSNGAGEASVREMANRYRAFLPEDFGSIYKLSPDAARKRLTRAATKQVVAEKLTLNGRRYFESTPQFQRSLGQRPHQAVTHRSIITHLTVARAFATALRTHTLLVPSEAQRILEAAGASPNGVHRTRFYLRQKELSKVTIDLATDQTFNAQSFTNRLVHKLRRLRAHGLGNLVDNHFSFTILSPFDRAQALKNAARRSRLPVPLHCYQIQLLVSGFQAGATN